MYSIKKLIIKPFLVLILTAALLGCVTSSDSDAPSTDKKQAADANIALGMVSLQKGDVRTAKQKLLAAVKVAPKYPAGWYTLAYYYEVTGDEVRANQYYLQALHLAPNSGDTNNNYGTFLCQNGQYQSAIKHFLVATQDASYIDTAAAYENAGLCSLRIPDLKQAKYYFTKAVAQDPSRVKSLTDLAAICYKTGDYKDAYTYLKQLFTISTPTPPALLLAAQTAKQLRLTSEMNGFIQQLIRNYPGTPQAKKARALIS